MADSAIAIADIVGRIISKVDEISSLPKECVKLRDVVQKLQPIYNMFSNQLQRPAQRDVMEMLYNALRKAEEVVDFINQHPYWVKARSSKYTKKLKDAMSDIDIWMNRVKSFATGETLNRVTITQEEVKEYGFFLKNIIKEEKEAKEKLSKLIDEFQDMKSEIKIMGQEYYEQQILLMNHCSNDESTHDDKYVKDERFQEFSNEHDRLLFAKLETCLDKSYDFMYDDFKCPINKNIMEDPQINTVSGITYEKEAILKHIGNSISNDMPLLDPLTQLPMKGKENLVNNLTLRNVINEWKGRKKLFQDREEETKEKERSLAEKERNLADKEKSIKSEKVGLEESERDYVRKIECLSKENEKYKKKIETIELEKEALEKSKQDYIRNKEEYKTRIINIESEKKELARKIETLELEKNQYQVSIINKNDVEQEFRKDNLEALLTMRRETRTEKQTKKEKGWLYGYKNIVKDVEIVVKDGHTDYVYALIVHEGFLYSGSWDNTIRKWDLSSNECVSVLKGHTGTVREVVIIMPGDTYGVCALTVHEGFLYSGSEDNTIRKWDLSSNECVSVLKGHMGTVCALTVHEGFLYSGSRDKPIRKWDLSSNECITVLKGHMGTVFALTVHEGFLYSGSYDNTIRKWDLSSNECVSVLKGHTNGVYALTVHEGFLYSGSGDNTIRKWDLSSNECVSVVKGHTSTVYALTVHEGFLYSGSRDKPIRKWDLSSNECITVLKGHMGTVYALTVHEGFLYSGSGDKTIRKWNL